ncbi:MAG: VOC family protein [Ferruginibacter sp.]
MAGSPNNINPGISTAIAPWLSVRNSAKASDFYKAAFGAIETYRFEDPGGGLVVKLSVDGAEFWVSGESVDKEESGTELVGGDSVRMILTVADPEALFTRALQVGATEIFPVGEEHGWKLGRLSDPFGLHWEIGYQLADS